MDVEGAQDSDAVSADASETDIDENEDIDGLDVLRILEEGLEYKLELERTGTHIQQHLEDLKRLQKKLDDLIDKEAFLRKESVMSHLRFQLLFMEADVNCLRDILSAIPDEPPERTNAAKLTAGPTLPGPVAMNPKVLRDMGLGDLADLVTKEVTKLFPSPAAPKPPKPYLRTRGRRVKSKARNPTRPKRQTPQATRPKSPVSRKQWRERKLGMKKVGKKLRLRRMKVEMMGSRTLEAMENIVRVIDRAKDYVSTTQGYVLLVRMTGKLFGWKPPTALLCLQTFRRKGKIVRPKGQVV